MKATLFTYVVERDTQQTDQSSDHTHTNIVWPKMSSTHGRAAETPTVTDDNENTTNKQTIGCILFKTKSFTKWGVANRL